MSIELKYRVHEVAKDFGLNSKAITDIMTRYLTPPKNHMQALTEQELNVIFDYITLHNQIDSIEQVYAPVYREQASESQTAPEVSKAPKNTSPAPTTEAKAQDVSQSQPEKTEVTPMPKPKKNVRIIDTRGGGAVDLSKYDNRVEHLVPERAGKMKSGREKFRQRNRGQQPSQKRRQEEQEKMRRLQLEIAKKQPLKVSIPDEISVGELASRLKKTGAEVVKQLMKLGVMASLSDVIDFDTASLAAMEFGAKIEHEVIVTIEERLIDVSEDKEEDLLPRDPVVVVMGHVDHGKTSLLDAIRKTNVVSGEAGGITQHIGAYRVKSGDREITFLDTPGHEAFTSMRLRGAMATDIAILVIAADDGIMPQTVEAISHARSAEIPIIVAINKIDKVGSDPERIKTQLTEHGLVPEEWGGDTIVCPVSAHTGEGLAELLEMVILTADMRELKANPNRAASGCVIEARLDKGRGPITTLLVQNGTLHQGDIIIAGQAVGRVRAMVDDKGRKLNQAGPSIPVEIMGMSEVPGAGEQFYAVADERMARELAEQRRQEAKAAVARPAAKVSLEDLFSQIQEGQIKHLNIIVKADVQGSAEAVRASLEKLSNEEVRVQVIHSAVGAINESDILLASTSDAIIVGFNVRPDSAARDSAERAGVDVRLYRVIYECIEEIETAMKGMLAPKFREVVLGHAEIRQTFRVSGVGTIAGCHVTDGKITRNSSARLLRENVVIYEGSLASLKRFKDDAREVAAGYDCGLSLDKYNDIKEGDVVEAFTMEEVKQ